LYDNQKEVKSVAFLSSGVIVFLLLITELCDVSLSAPGGGKGNTALIQVAEELRCGGQPALVCVQPRKPAVSYKTAVDHNQIVFTLSAKHVSASLGDHGQ
jgi:hypothetical protein